MKAPTLTPDSARYLTIHTPPSPFHLRLLLPWLCGQSSTRWYVATWLGVALMALGTALMAPGWQGIAAAALVLTLPSVRFSLAHVVLVDMAALGLATTSAALAVHGWIIPAIILALLAGAAKESAPVFAALFAWNPILLVGLLVPAVVKLARKPGTDVLREPEHAWILAHPIKAGRKYHARMVIDAMPALVTPWGACVLALGAPSVQLFATLAVAYAQLFVATDTVRLYQWSAPVVAIAATSAVGPRWWPLMVVVTLFNPLRGDGV
ncbi:MAG: hypothetical protein QM286_05960 [Acidobacteriota bacterium]|nr:hypothetical protein [Acidobacteriota bacterium]